MEWTLLMKGQVSRISDSTLSKGDKGDNGDNASLAGLERLVKTHF